MFVKNAAHSLLPVLLFPFVLGACAPASKKVKSHAGVYNLSGLSQDKSQLPSLVYKRPGAPGLGAYESFIIDPVKIGFDDATAKIDYRELGELRAYFWDELAGELRESGYSVVTVPGPRTLRISPVMSNVSIPGGGANAANIAVGVLAAPITPAVGGVTVETAFSESMSGRIDAVVINRSQGSRVFNSSMWSTKADVKSAFKQWAVGISDAVDRAHGR